MEIWKPIEGFEGRYEVSNLGNVRSLDMIVNNGYKDYLKRGRVLVKTISGYGKYHKVHLCDGISGFKQMRVHRLVANAFIPNPENKETVNHINGDKQDNRVENLEWATQAENNRHAHDNNLMRFKPNVVYRNGLPIKINRSIEDTAIYLGVDQSTICHSISRGNSIKKCYTVQYI